MAEFVASENNTWDVIGMTSKCGVIQLDEEIGAFGFVPESSDHIFSQETLRDIVEALADLNGVYEEDEEPDYPECGHSYAVVAEPYSDPSGKLVVFLACECGDVIKVTPRKVEV